MPTVSDVMTETDTRMGKSVEALNRELATIRTGRASPTLVESLMVDYYGVPTPLNQLATISVPEARSLMIQPWDKSSLKEVERSIMQSDLGLMPTNDGNAIYTVLVEPGMTVPIGPNDLVVTTIQFRALQTTQATVVSYLPALGIYGETRVFGAGIQNNITGDISATAFVEVVQFCSVVCPTDINGNFETTAFDLAVLSGCWGGVMPGTCVCLDADHNGDIGAFDMAVLLGAWGPCSGVPGACCNADGMGSCQILLEGDCDAVGGAFLGPATQCEDCLHEACSPDARDCSTANGTAGCDDVACCELV